MKDEPRAPVKSEKGCTKRQGLRGWDIAGIVIGVPVFLLGLCALGVWWAGAILLLISVGLFIPSKVYEHRVARAIGFVALTLATAVTSFCAVILGWGAYGLLSGSTQDSEWMWWGMAVIGTFLYLIAFVVAVSGIGVLLKKIKPRPAHTVIVIAAGIAVGALIAYLLCFQD